MEINFLHRCSAHQTNQKLKQKLILHLIVRSKDEQYTVQFKY